MRITPNQIRALKEVAGILGRDPSTHGRALFIKMFERNPAWVEKFPAWKGQSLAQIQSSEKINSHGGKVVSELANWFNNIDNPSAILKGQGVEHKGRAIGIEYFENFLPVLDATLAQQMGSAYTPDMRDAVLTAWPGVILPGMRTGY